MEKVAVQVLGVSTSPSSLGSFVLTLAETDGNRRLQIIIGASEAQSIAIILEDVKTARPLTHDLLKNTVEILGAAVTEVVIHSLRDGVFFARIELIRSGEIFSLDARPSDAIALALRVSCPLFVANRVMDEAGVEVRQEETEDQPDQDSLSDDPESDPESLDPGFEAEEEPAASAPSAVSVLDRLITEMNQAIEAEDYERAASLRDQINKLKGSS
ncbi:MAG: bifunctional nuclease family protein [Bacteroidetes bacterium]|nr:bifunctional nuclease family protein [Bacteroidota bacterium]